MPTIAILLLIIIITRFNLKLLAKFRSMDQQECSICLGTMQDAVTIECGHQFCNSCINSWLLSNRSCPLCRARIQTDYSDDEDSGIEFEDVEENGGQFLPGFIGHSQALINQDIAAHETFFTAIGLLMSHGHISREDLERLAVYLRWREEEESRMDYDRHWMVVATRADMPLELLNMHLMFPEGSRSLRFAMEVINGDAIAFIQLQENYAPRRLYLCPHCNLRVYNQVTDFVRHFSNCQYL